MRCCARASRRTPTRCFRASPADVQAIWEQAASQGVIPAALTAEIPAAVTRVHPGPQRQPAAVRRSRRRACPRSDEMLRPRCPRRRSRSSSPGSTCEHQGEPWSGLWPAVDAAVRRQPSPGGFGSWASCTTSPSTTSPWSTALLAAEKGSRRSPPRTSPRSGYYDAAKWAPLIGTAIPPSIPGGTAAEQAANYAELLAAQVRVSFPTATLADQVKAGVIPVTGNAGTADRWPTS